MEKTSKFHDFHTSILYLNKNFGAKTNVYKLKFRCLPLGTIKNTPKHFSELKTEKKNQTL